MLDLHAKMLAKKDTAATEELWGLFKNTMQKAIKTFIPQKPLRPKPHQPRITPELRNIMNSLADRKTGKKQGISDEMPSKN